MNRLSAITARAPTRTGVWWWCALLGLCAPALAQRDAIQLPPALGSAGYDNEYRVARTLIASLSLDGNPSGVSLWGDAAFSSAPGEVIAGARSVRLTGTTAMLEIDYTALGLLAGEIYALEYDYRIIDDAGAVSAMSVFGRWGQASDWHADPWGLRPEVFGNAGTQRRQFLFGPNGYPTFLLGPASDATVIVDNLRVWRIHSEAFRPEAHIFTFGFPRLADFNFDSPFAGALYNPGVLASDYEDVLGRFDFVNGVQLDNTIGDTSWAERMRAQNPGMVMIPFRHTYMAHQLASNEPIGGSAGLIQLFNRAIPDEWIMRDPEGEPLNDLIFEGNTQLDPTWYCPPVDGMTFPDFMRWFIGSTVLPSGLWDGIHFDQAEWFPNPLLAHTVNGPLPPIDMNRDGIADPKPLMFGTMRSAFETFFSLMRRRFGSTRVLFGNPGRIPLDAGVLGTLNGWQQELFTAYEIESNGDWDTTRSAHWHDFLRNYLYANTWTSMPQVLSVQGTGHGLGVETGGTTGHGYPNRVPELEPRDFQRMRLGLTTTLLGNGFFGYDFVDNTTPPVWFDEYALDAQGNPTTDLSGKGYLGQPLGSAAEITRPAPVVIKTGFEEGFPPGMWLGNGATWTTDPDKVIEGAASLMVSSASPADFVVFETNPLVIELEPGKTYDLVATFRVLEYDPETYAGLLTMGIAVDPREIDFNGRSFIYHQDIEGPGQTITMRTQVKVWGPWLKAYAHFADRGTVAVDSVRLAEVGGGAFRRDFEGGIALVNPTPEPLALTQAEIAGPLGRTGIRRINGVQDLAVNNGQAVTSGLTVPPGDGIILVANHIGAPAPITPTAFTVSPTGPEPALDLTWTTPPGGTCAGHFIEYKLADGSSWDRFELAGPVGYRRIEFLAPGSAYDVRMAAFDFAGRISAFTDPVRTTTLGAPPVRAWIASVEPMARGTVVVLLGEALANTTQDLTDTYPIEFDGTSITVNGVPARLAFISPGVIAFGVPETVGVGLSVVRVHRAGVASAGFVAPVLEAPAPACAADINTDERTDVADFMLFATHFGRVVPVGTKGDLNADGVVGLPDFNLLAGDFGCGT